MKRGEELTFVCFRGLYAVKKTDFLESPYFKKKGKRAFQVFFLYIYTV